MSFPRRRESRGNRRTRCQVWIPAYAGMILHNPSTRMTRPSRARAKGGNHQNMARNLAKRKATGGARRQVNRLPPERRVADILLAARAVFTEKGYGDALISDIA